MAGIRRRLAGVTAIRSDGRRLATTGPNGDLKVWDTVGPELLFRRRYRHRVVAADWNPTVADLLATLGADGSVSVWRTLDDHPPRGLARLALPSGRAGMITWMPDGRHVACAGADGVVSLWDVVTGEHLTQVLGPPSDCLTIRPGPRDTLRTVHRDGSVRWTGLQRRDRPRVHPGTPLAAAGWSGSGLTLAAVREDGLLEVRGGPASVRFTRPVATVREPALAWHGDDVLVLAEDKTLTGLDGNGRTLWRHHLDSAPTSLAVSGSLLAIGSCTFAPALFALDDAAAA